MGVSLVRVGDSRERGRGRGQGVSAIMAAGPLPPQTLGTNKHALLPLLLLREKKTTLPPFCFKEQKQTIAAISVGEQRLIKHSIASQRGIHSVACKTLQEEKRSTLA